MHLITKKHLLIASLVLGGACGSKPAPVTPAPSPPKVAPAAPAPPTSTPAAPEAIPAAPTVTAMGMEDPFKRMNTAGVEALEAGYKALRKKRYAEARAAFHEVVVAYPDKPAARFQELRAAVLDGDFAAAPALWRQLLVRDFVGYSKRLDDGKELAALRKSPQWALMQAIKAELKTAYVAGLGQGFFFVARTRPAAVPGLASEGEAVKLELDQEVYHFDPGSRRIRRVSDSGGKVLAIHHDGEQRKLMMLMAGALTKSEGKLAFGKPEATVLSSLRSSGRAPSPSTPAPCRSTSASRARASRSGR